MKTKLLIILVAITIGVIVASTVGTMEYQSTYNQNCNSDDGKVVGFLKCIYINEDVAEPIPVLDEGYEICLIENGTAKMVSESELQEHLTHGATTGDCSTLFPRPEISSDDVKSSGTFYPRIHISILPDSDTKLHYVDPDFVTIGPGSQVTWSNYDDVPISLNSIDPDNPWSTAVISPDGYDTLTFDETGIYEYRGSPEIHGFIIVMADDDSTRHYRDFYFSDWYDQNELNNAGCDKPILSHLSIYSNLLDGEFNGKYGIEEIGLPDGVTKEKFEECVEFILEKRIEELLNDSLRPDDRLQIRHSAGYTTVYITLSSWDEYNEWEKYRGTEHDAMPPVIIDDTNIDPIVSDLLNEMWKFEDYEISRHDDNLFTKIIQKDYSVPNHHGIQDWLESEYAKQFGKSNDGYSHHFEYGDKVYTVIMLAVD